MPTPKKKKSDRRLTRGIIERYHYIDNAVRDGKPVTCESVAKVFGVRRETVQEDMDDLRDRLGRPLEYDARRNTWFFTEEVTTQLPDMVLTEGEFYHIMVLRGAVEQYRGTPYFQQLTRAAEKLASRLKTKVSFTADDYASRISFHSMGRPKIDPAVFDLVSRAAARKVELTFDYRKPGETKARRRTAQVWHIAHRANNCYALGYDPEAKDERMFALPRIKNPALTAKRYVVPKGFSAEKYFANAFCVMGGTGDHRVVVRFRGATADRVQECEWHPGETIRELGGGVIEYTVRLGALEEIARWVFFWGAEAEVIGPPALCQRIAATVAALAKTYGGEKF